jgi:hypothetical protein
MTQISPSSSSVSADLVKTRGVAKTSFGKKLIAWKHFASLTQKRLGATTMLGISLLFVGMILFACCCVALANQERDREDTQKETRMLNEVERRHFNYFARNQDPDTGLILDRSTPASPASIAAVGFALTAYPIAVQRHWIKRQEAAAWTHKVLKTLSTRPMGPEAEGNIGYHGVFYHMLDPKTGLRATSPKYWNSELSSIDTALLMVGVLFARDYYTWDNAVEKEIRNLAEKLFDNVEWNWISDERGLIHHAWTPETGMSPGGYQGYSEAMLMYLIALSSTTHKMPQTTWETFIGGAKPVTQNGQTYVICPDSPLFVYQYPHCWIDFRDIRDPIMRQLGWDWFENSRRATKAQYNYAMENPHKFRDYGTQAWGLTACDGPGDVEKEVDGVKRKFSWYVARGCPNGPDDGTIAPTAALSSTPFTPELSLPLLRHWYADRKELLGFDGFADGFNPTFDPTTRNGWICPVTLGIDQGPILLMLENYRSDFVWKIMRDDPNLRLGLKRAGFTGGWLDR